MNFIPFLIYIVVGAILGATSGDVLTESIDKNGIMGFIFSLLIIALEILVVVFGHIIVHEGGHLVFGLLSGYEFVSFRIGSFMFIKENGKLVVKRYNVAGTGGQCLMMPPSNVSAYNYPYILYNLGGSLANTIVALVSLALFLLIPKTDYVSEFLMMSFGFGMASALTNGIPLKLSGIANDGYNILSLNKDKQARRAFYIQLYVNGLQTKGTRLKDMPAGYFELPENSDLTNPLIVTIGVFKCNYLHDKKEFTKAKEYSQNLIDNAPGLLGIYKNELECELLFYEIIGSNRQDEIEKLYTKELQDYIKATSSYVSRRRLMYAYEMFVNHDKDAASKELEKFEQVAKNYPYAGEIEAERELIEFIDNMAVIKNV